MDNLRPGDVFQGRYRIDALLGAGGFAKVYEAFDARTSRRVAIKVLTHDRGAGYEAATRARFDRETAAVANLRSPHTVALLDCGETADGLLFMVFEHVPGEDLGEVLNRWGRIEPPVVIHVLRQLLAALREAHERGILHRDIKPENIRVFEFQGDPWTVKLLDFGLARPAGAHDSVVTAAGHLVGTPRYMAPEQLTEGDLTPATDLYALGIVAAECLLGREALHGNQWADQLVRLQSGYLLSIPERERLNPALIAIIQRMTARRPADRFRTANDVFDALVALEAGRPPAARPMPSLPSAPIPAPTLPAADGRPRGTARLLVIVVALAALVVAAAAILLTLIDRRTEETPPAARVVRTSNPLAKPAEVVPTAASPRAVDHGPPDVGSDAADQDKAEPDLESRGTPGCGRSTKVRGRFDMRDTSDVRALGGVGQIPREYNRRRKHPLVVLLHQTDEPPEVLLEYSGFPELVDREQFIVLAPNSPDYSGGFLPASWSPWTGEGATDADQVRIFISEVAAEFCVDSSRVFIVGHGQGGRVANRLTCDPSVRAVVTTSFRESASDYRCDGAKPFLLVNGLRSRREPVDGGRGCGISPTSAPMLSLEDAEKKWFARNGCGGKPIVLDEHPGGRCFVWECEVPLKSCHLEGGHPWPGTPPRPNVEKYTPGCDGAPADFPLAETIWQFFSTLE